MVKKWNFSIEMMLKVTTLFSALIILTAPIASFGNENKYSSYVGVFTVSILWWFTTFVICSSHTVI